MMDYVYINQLVSEIILFSFVKQKPGDNQKLSNPER